MGAPTTDNIRNIVLVGQDGAGKTSLAESILYVTGKTSRMGTVHDGKSNLDYDPEEIKRQYTISASIAPVEYKKTKINVIDTPGTADFIGDTIASMEAVETALFVVDANSGPQVMHTKIWRKAEEQNLKKACFINHIDKENANFDETLSALRDEFGSRLAPVTIPMGIAADFKGVIDIVGMRAHVFEGGKDIVSDIPAEFADAAEAAREELCEAVAEADDELMMKYLEGEPFTQEEIEGLIALAISEDLFVPVFVGCTLNQQGVCSLLDDVVAYFPKPTAHEPYALADSEDTYAIDPAGEPALLVFKTVSDNFVGRLSFAKVLSGAIKPGMDLINSRSSKKERLGHINVMCGKDTSDIDESNAGDIVVIPKLEALTGDTLSQSGKINLAPIPFPEPIYPVAIEAQNKNDVDKVNDFLAKAIETDPTVTLRRDEETHQTILTALGETQITVLLSRLKDSTNIEVDMPEIRVPYRETIRKKAEAQGRHKKQTGGSGQFGDCWLRLEPNPGGGYEFIDEIVGGHIPRNYIPAVDKGVQEMLERGVLAGYPIVDVKCAVYDGSYHPVDSNEMAFKTAAHIGFKAAAEKADMYLLEPMANLTVTCAEEYAGAIMGDVPTRRGRIMGMDTNERGESVIRARVPYAEVVQYGKSLRSLTRGSGEYTVEVEGYEEVPFDAAQKIIAAYQASKNEG